MVQTNPDLKTQTSVFPGENALKEDVIKGGKQIRMRMNTPEHATFSSNI